MPSLTVNGQPITYRMDPRTPLLFALREASNLTGAKNGCGTGHCGACTVHVDGRAVRSCMTSLGALEGASVVTIEGLAQDRSHPVQQAFLAGNVVQCGFCVPGMIMTIAAFIENNLSPTDADMDAAITNICRCGIYPRVPEAVRAALVARRGAAPPEAPDAPVEPPAALPPPAEAAGPGAVPTPVEEGPPPTEGPELVPG